MIEQLQEKIEIIKNHYKGNSSKGLSSEAERQLNNIENKIAEVNLKNEMAANPLIDKLRIQLIAKVANIEKTLKTQKVLGKEDIIKREILFAKQDWYKDELSMFVDSKEVFEQINTKLDIWIKKLK